MDPQVTPLADDDGLSLYDPIDADLDADAVTVDLFTFPARGRERGVLWSGSLVERSRESLAFGHVDRFEPTVGQFVDYLGTRSFPVVADGQLHWSDGLEGERVTRLLAEIEALDDTTLVGEFFRPLQRVGGAGYRSAPSNRQ